MRLLKIYKGVGLGDIIKITSSNSRKKLAKILRIYKKNSNVRFVVRTVKNGKTAELDVAETSIIFHDETMLCHCKIAILLREGCICGGS